MRVREWYGWHFPELGKIITDNHVYAKVVKLMGVLLHFIQLRDCRKSKQCSVHRFLESFDWRTRKRGAECCPNFHGHRCWSILNHFSTLCRWVRKTSPTSKNFVIKWYPSQSIESSYTSTWKTGWTLLPLISHFLWVNWLGQDWLRMQVEFLPNPYLILLQEAYWIWPNFRPQLFKYWELRRHYSEHWRQSTKHQNMDWSITLLWLDKLLQSTKERLVFQGIRSKVQDCTCTCRKIYSGNSIWRTWRRGNH